MMVDLNLSETAEAAQEEGLRHLQALDPNGKVGALHHTVPRFYLNRFARGNYVSLRVPGELELRPTNIDKIGVRDFYTAVVAADGLVHMQAATKLPDDDLVVAWQAGTGRPALDGRMEDVLSVVESWAAIVITRLVDDPSTRMTKEETYALTTFLSFQMQRGIRARREIELFGEYYAKTMLRPALRPKARRQVELAAARRDGRTPARGNGRGLPPKHIRADILTDGQLRKIGIRPTANEHLIQLADVQERIGPHLFVRPFTLVELDEPLLITCDEPVVVFGDDEVQHHPGCALTAKQRRRLLKDAMAAGREHRDIVHVYPTRPQAVAVAETIAMPLDPRRAIVLGPKDTVAPTYFRLQADAAAEFAEDLNSRIIGQSYAWVVAHPNHPTFTSMEIPAPGPLVMACDKGSPAADTVNRPPNPRRPHRLRRSEWQSE